MRLERPCKRVAQYFDEIIPIIKIFSTKMSAEILDKTNTDLNKNNAQIFLKKKNLKKYCVLYQNQRWDC